MQGERQFEKKTAARDKKLKGEMAQVMANSYLWQKYNSHGAVRQKGSI
jgi:hypothetical protein